MKLTKKQKETLIKKVTETMLISDVGEEALLMDQAGYSYVEGVTETLSIVFGDTLSYEIYKAAKKACEKERVSL